MKKIAILGEAMLELNGQGFTQLEQTYGGDTINTAVYLSRLISTQHQVDYVTAVGTDKLSDKMLGLWQEEGVSTSLVLRDTDHIPGMYMIELNPQGERSFLYWRNDSAARYLFRHPRINEITEQLKFYDAIYLSGISLAILPAEDKAICLRVLSEVAQQGVAIIFDSNYRPKLWSSLDETREYCEALYRLASIVLVTQEDECSIWDDEDDSFMRERLHACGVGVVVIKQGEFGCTLSCAKQTENIATQVVDNVVDTTAAGDAFNAGFLSVLLDNANKIDEAIPQETLVNACARGNKVAGAVIQHKGAIIPKIFMLDI